VAQSLSFLYKALRRLFWRGNIDSDEVVAVSGVVRDKCIQSGNSLIIPCILWDLMVCCICLYIQFTYITIPCYWQKVQNGMN